MTIPKVAKGRRYCIVLPLYQKYIIVSLLLLSSSLLPLLLLLLLLLSLITYTILILLDPSDPDLLYLLLRSLQNTKTVAMCNIYIVMNNQLAQSINSSTISVLDSHNSSKRNLQQQQPGKNSPNHTLWSHGYLHHIDMKQSILMLSVFERGLLLLLIQII